MTGLGSAVPGAPLLLVLIGLLPACALLFARLRPLALAVAPWAAAPALVLASTAAPGLQLDLPWLLLGARLGLDDTGRIFLFFTALLWLVSGIYARGYLARDRGLPRFFACFLLTMTGNLGLVLALDMVSFYCFFSWMSFAAYGLIVHHGDAAAVRAGRVYIYMVVLGELLLFTALVIAALVTGHLTFSGVRAALPAAPLRDVVIGLALAGFGIKAGALPLHVWLPLAHPAAPTPASAVLSGAMIKAGLLGWLRLLPLGAIALPHWGHLVMATGVAAMLLGAALGGVQRDPKAVLAYSSVSQMGWAILALGIGLVAPASWPVGLAALQLFALHHALAKGALFLGVGAAAASARGSRQRAAVAAGLLVPALALAGAPWTSGAAAKTALKAAAKAAPDPWPAWLDWLLPIGSVATALVMARFLAVVWPRKPDAALAGSALAAWYALLAALVGVLWVAPLPAFRGGIEETPSVTALVASLAPVLVAAAVAWKLARSARGQRLLAHLQIPAGDVVVLAERGSAALRRRLHAALLAARRHLPAPPWRALLERAGARCGDVVTHLERRLTRWAVGGAMFLAITGLLAWLLTRDLAGHAATPADPTRPAGPTRPRRRARRRPCGCASANPGYTSPMSPPAAPARETCSSKHVMKNMSYPSSMGPQPRPDDPPRPPDPPVRDPRPGPPMRDPQPGPPVQDPRPEPPPRGDPPRETPPEIDPPPKTPPKIDPPAGEPDLHDPGQLHTATRSPTHRPPARPTPPGPRPRAPRA